MDEIDDQEELKHESENVKELLGQVKQAGLDLEACALRAPQRGLCVFLSVRGFVILHPQAEMFFHHILQFPRG